MVLALIITGLILAARLVLSYYYIELFKLIPRKYQTYKIVYLAAFVLYIVYVALSTIGQVPAAEPARLFPIIGQALMVFILFKIVKREGR